MARVVGELVFVLIGALGCRVIRRFDEVLGGLALVTTRLYTLVLVVGAMTIVEVSNFWMLFD